VKHTIVSIVDVYTPGDYELTDTLEDRSGNSVVVTRTITVMDGFLESRIELFNTDFSTEQTAPIPQPATTGWGWHGTGEFSVNMPGGDEGTAVIDVTNMGTVPHGVQFYQLNKVVETGGIYKMTFKMKASVARNIRLSLEAGTNLRWFEVLDVTTEWATYEVIMTSIGSTYTNGKMAFFLGKVDDTSVLATFEIDDVNITLLGYQS